MKKVSYLALAFLAGFVHAQGVLPKTSTGTAAAVDSSYPLLIGNTVPESLIVMGENGMQRSLLSYKAHTELLVVVFFSQPCASPQTLWPELRRINEHFKDWRVAFLAVSATSRETLSTTVKQERLPWPTVTDEKKSVATALKITATPELLIIDEFGILKYRGPVAPARKALNTYIAQISPVQDPEPPMGEGCPY